MCRVNDKINHLRSNACGSKRDGGLKQQRIDNSVQCLELFNRIKAELVTVYETWFYHLPPNDKSFNSHSNYRSNTELNKKKR